MDCRCPRKLSNYPEEPCSFGKEAFDAARQGKRGGCEWFVADAEANYCFFKYMKDDGRAVPTHRIARLLLIDDNEVKRIVQSFRRRITQLFNIENHEDILG